MGALSMFDFFFSSSQFPNFCHSSEFKVSGVTYIAMVNAIRGVFVSCDIPMAQFIINMNGSLPSNQKFIIRVLDNTHLFVQPHAAEMIRTAVSEYRDQNTYEKPA